MEKAKVLVKLENGTYLTPEGEPCTKYSSPGYYETEGHYFHVRSSNDILHVNPKGVINSVGEIVITPGEDIKTITKEQFENELHNVMIMLSLGRYLKAN